MNASFDDFTQLSDRLNFASAKLVGMTSTVARARQVRAFEGDRRKRALALAVRDVMALKPDCSAAAADNMARASDGYQDAMQRLGKDLVDAERTVSEWEACKVEWESARSLLAAYRQIAGIQ